MSFRSTGTTGKIYEHNACCHLRHARFLVWTLINARLAKSLNLRWDSRAESAPFRAMAKTYGVKVPDIKLKQIKDAWRASAPEGSELLVRA
jgi:hypothetical protein